MQAPLKCGSAVKNRASVCVHKDELHLELLLDFCDFNMKNSKMYHRNVAIDLSVVHWWDAALY